MRSLPSPHRLLTALLSLLIFVPSHAAQVDAVPQPWRDGARSLFSEARAAFAKTTGREARLGEALMLLQVQPKTDSNIKSAHRLLAEVRKSDAGDELAITALYYLGRIEHVHRSHPDPEAASRYYGELLAAHPTHPLAGQARVKLALIKLYRTQAPADRRRVFDRITRLAGQQPSSDSRRDLHLALGDVALRFDLGRTAALDHFLAAYEMGITRPTTRADVLVRIGELARLTDRPSVARTHYRLFLAQFQRDNRRLMVETALATLPITDSMPQNRP